MNLSALMNDGEDEAPKRPSPEVSKTAQPSAQYGGYPSLPPLQVPAGAQHQYQLAAHQHPPAPQQYTPSDAYSANAPPSRTSSHPYPHRSPSQTYPGIPRTTSISPSPSSRHSQTPQRLRQSPLSSVTHPPPPLQHHQYPHLHSQPSTPLGPPPAPFARSATNPDLGSPYHQRSYSGASASPPVHYPAPGHHIESPNATYSRPSPQLRRTSDYLSHVERERSLSVSPKTQVPPRPSSIASRHSSQQGSYDSNRSSTYTLHAGPISGSPAHQPPQFGAPPPQAFVQTLNSASEVPQPTPSSIQALPNPFSQTGPAETPTSLSRQTSHHAAPAPPPLLQHHSSQKMGMSNLLTPTNEVPPVVNGNSAGAMARENATSQKGPSIFMKPSPKRSGVNSTPPQPLPPPPPATEQSRQQYVKTEIDPGQDNSSESAVPEVKPSLKRSATESSTSQPPLKQRKMTARKYTQRPPWAQLSRHNPRFQQQGPIQNGGMPQQHTPQQSVVPQSNGQAMANGGILDGRDPWNYNPPLDMDLIQASMVLGRWEKSMKWNTPYPDILKVVQDFFWQNLEQLGEVGMDPREGSVEIEAKIGSLIDNNSDQRVKLPVMTMCVIPPELNGRYSFRSEMQEFEHKHLNAFLNDVIQRSQAPGRIALTYKHHYETDSFHQLTAYGRQFIPPTLQRHIHPKKEPRLRITKDSSRTASAGDVKARLIKINIANLHIHNPAGYDSRISINVELNLHRTDIDAAALLPPDDAEQKNEPPRKKDRLAYRHLAFSLDLTKVESLGMPPKYEMEQEVDAGVLRLQMQLAREGKPSAFGDVVSGFLDNLVFLMRQKAVS